MTKEFAERYLNWLSTQIAIDPVEYAGLLSYLHQKEFVWIIPNDDNRIGDALELRKEFWGEGNKIPRQGVSTLEVLVALSRRLEFNGGGDKEVWAWRLISNLGLQRMFDPINRRKAYRIEDILNTLIWRTYEPDGRGGFFPLKDAKEDQTKVEIWYQMSAYIIEHIKT